MGTWKSPLCTLESSTTRPWVEVAMICPATGVAATAYPARLTPVAAAPARNWRRDRSCLALAIQSFVSSILPSRYAFGSSRLLKKAHLRRPTFGGYPRARAALRRTGEGSGVRLFDCSRTAERPNCRTAERGRGREHDDLPHRRHPRRRHRTRGDGRGSEGSPGGRDAHPGASLRLQGVSGGRPLLPGPAGNVARHVGQCASLIAVSPVTKAK